MKKRVIILGQGRSGTTLMQRILHCAIDDGYFCGENGGFWHYLYTSVYGSSQKNPGFQRVEKSEKIEYTKMDNYKPCWFNFYNKEAIINEYRLLFDRMYQSHKNRVFGFKEIRFPNDYEELKKYLMFFRELFPDVFFVFTIRDIETLSKSAWWPSHIEENPEVMNELINESENFKKIINEMQNCYLFEYENYQNLDEIKKVFMFLGEYINEEKIKMVLNKRYKN